MSARVETLAVLGLGLLGGSVAAAAKARGVAQRVVGSGRRHSALADAVASGLVDAVAAPAEAVAGADLVVLATPVAAMGPVLEQAAPGLSAGALVTDVGSVKGLLHETLPGLLPPGVQYVGSHPMAGSHLRGVEHADADLFEGAACVVTPGPRASADAVARVVGFWEALGCRVVRRDPAGHDADAAWISHVPHALAFAFAAALEAAPASAGALRGAGFRDFTRIAHSEAELWSEILTSNRKAVTGPLQASARALEALAGAVEAGDAEAVERFIARGRSALARIAGATSGPAPEAQPEPHPGAEPEIPTASRGQKESKSTQ